MAVMCLAMTQQRFQSRVVVDFSALGQVWRNETPLAIFLKHTTTPILAMAAIAAHARGHAQPFDRIADLDC